jgi:hypothetical protein
LCPYRTGRPLGAGVAAWPLLSPHIPGDEALATTATA